LLIFTLIFPSGKPEILLSMSLKTYIVQCHSLHIFAVAYTIYSFFRINLRAFLYEASIS
jgi:hypothetical protein